MPVSTSLPSQGTRPSKRSPPQLLVSALIECTAYACPRPGNSISISIDEKPGRPILLSLSEEHTRVPVNLPKVRSHCPVVERVPIYGGIRTGSHVTQRCSCSCLVTLTDYSCDNILQGCFCPTKHFVVAVAGIMQVIQVSNEYRQILDDFR